jgi:hypothetical protein
MSGEIIANRIGNRDVTLAELRSRFVDAARNERGSGTFPTPFRFRAIVARGNGWSNV